MSGRDPAHYAAMLAAPRCGAKTRSGAQCRSPAVHGARRCRMHGGRGSGPPLGNQNAYKHGHRARADRLREQRRAARALLARLDALS